MKKFRRTGWGLCVLVAALTWGPQAWAAASPYCPSRSGTVVAGGSVVIDVSDCDGPLNIGIGAGPASVAPSHGTAIVDLPTGPTGDSQSVTYTHDGSATGNDSFGLEDENGDIVTITVNVTAGSPIGVTPAALSLKTGAAYSQLLTAFGGTAPYTYSSTTLPAGLNLAADTGLLAGTPTVRGNYSFTVTATDAGSVAGIKSYGGTLVNPTFAFVPASVTVVTNQAASAQLPASGGVPPYSFTLQPGSTLPAGLSLSSSGLLTGIPTVPGTTSVDIAINDGSVDPQNPGADYVEIRSLSIVVSNAVAPDAPTIGAAVASSHQASVSFTPPGSNGGSAITGYTVTCNPMGVSASGGASPIVVAGLTNGVTYDCSATASNVVGTSVPSATVAVTPMGTPDAPALLSVSPGNAQAVVAFTPPASDGGSAITGYTATCGAATASGGGSPLTVTGLSNGTAYSCSVAASNALGTGAASASLPVTPATVPDAPAIGAAVAGSGQASVSFSAPAFDGGSPITGYTVSCGAASASGAGSPIVLTGLANGTSYSCSAVATNAVGSGSASAAVLVTPVGLPGAPVIGAATPGNGEAAIAFAPPVSNGGSAILSYTATCTAGPLTATGAGSPLTVTGMANGTTYNCTVQATNAVGTGAASASVSVTPAVAPDAPTIGTATRGNGQAIIDFTPAAANGGSAVTSFTASCGPGPITASASASPITVTGLTNGVLYNCSVTATNAAGTSAPSGTVAVTPATVPGVPSITAIQTGNGQLTIGFDAPASDGGSAVTGYNAVCDAGGFAAAGASSPLVVSGLTNGTTYNCSVTATNSVGTSAASASVAAIPSLKSFQGTSPSGVGLITATLSGGGAGCGFDTAQFIPVTGNPASPSGSTPAGITFPHGLFDFATSGCTPGSSVSVTLTYPTQIPVGSQYWKYGPTADNHSPHWYVHPVNFTGNTAQFTIVDGGAGDDDLDGTNGRMVDPGGLGVRPLAAGAVSIPTLSEWMLALLAALLGAMAWRGLARRAA